MASLENQHNAGGIVARLNERADTLGWPRRANGPLKKIGEMTFEERELLRRAVNRRVKCINNSSNEVRFFSSYEEARRFIQREGVRSRLWWMARV